MIFNEPNKTLVIFLFAFGRFLPQNLRVVNNWLMIFLYGEEQEASPEGGWEWNGIKSPFKTDFEWFKNFKPVNQNDILVSTYFKSGTTWHQVKIMDRKPFNKNFQEILDLILYRGDLKRDNYWLTDRSPFLDITFQSQEIFYLYKNGS